MNKLTSEENFDENSVHDKKDIKIFSIDRLLLRDDCDFQNETNKEKLYYENIHKNVQNIIKPLPIKRILPDHHAYLRHVSVVNGLDPSIKNASQGGSFQTIFNYGNTFLNIETKDKNESQRRKRSWSRAVFSNLQRKGLEKRFAMEKYITKPNRRKLASQLNLTDAQVKVWFQNRRMKWRNTNKTKGKSPKTRSPKSFTDDNDFEDDVEINVVD